MRTFLLIATMLLLPVGLFRAGVWVMGRMSKLEDADPRLNTRLQGYGTGEVEARWNEIASAQEPGGLDREKKALTLDLVFPFVYGGALAVSLLLGWALTGRCFSPGWCLLPVGIAMVADWVENTVLLGQLKLFAAGGSLRKPSIALASAATQIKLLALFICGVFVVALAVAVALTHYRSIGKS